MNKYIVLIFLLFYGCSIFKTKSIKSLKNTKTILIHANIISDNLFGDLSKIKTKIKISPDTISASVYPFLGVELGKLTLTKQKAVIHNKYTKQSDSITFKRSQQINLKAFQKLFINKKMKKDTIRYKNSYRDCFFTNYVFIEKFGEDSLFLPQKIILKNLDKEAYKSAVDEITIDYKSVNLF